MKFEWSVWTEVERISKRDDALLEEGGVYQVRLTDAQGTPLGRKRLKRPDPAGVLYIGCTVNSLRKRIRRIPRSRRHGKSAHTLGRKLYRLERRPELRGTLNSLTLQCRYAVSDHAAEGENRLLRQYQDAFGELPLLNGSIIEEEVAGRLRAALPGEVPDSRKAHSPGVDG